MKPKKRIYTDENGKKEEEIHQNGTRTMKTTLLIEPSQKYINNELKPRQKEYEKWLRGEKLILFMNLKKEKKEWQDNQADPDIPQSYRKQIDDRLRYIEKKIKEVKNEMETQ